MRVVGSAVVAMALSAALLSAADARDRYFVTENQLREWCRDKDPAAAAFIIGFYDGVVLRAQEMAVAAGAFAGDPFA